jgi:[ribosomal protein S5]-alanine N-acetyltransferase
MRAGVRLDGPRVTLRDFEPRDVDDVFLYASDPVVMQSAGWARHRTPFDSITYIQRCLSDTWGPLTLAVECRADARVIGVVDIRIVSHLWSTGEIGYTLARDYWGRGFNVEAGELLLAFGFTRLALRRIRAVSDLDNRRSVRTMEKLGMVRERIVDRAARRNGYRVDRIVYSIWQREWVRRQRTPGSSATTGGAWDTAALPTACADELG